MFCDSETPVAVSDWGCFLFCVGWTNALDFVKKQGGAQGIEHPVLVYLTSYRILRANQEFEQAQSVLQQGHHYLMTQADQIDDPHLRRSFLNHLWENREIQALSN